MSVSGDKGMMLGMTGGRELEAVAHRLSWDPWLSASAGLPLSITNKEQSRQCCDRPPQWCHPTAKHLRSLSFRL